MIIQSSYCNPKQLVLQIIPELPSDMVNIDNLQFPAVAAFIHIPEAPPHYISSPLRYFQKNASLSERWILDDKQNKKMELEFIDDVHEVIITKLINGAESIIKIPFVYNKRLLSYFNLDICHNLSLYKGFCCYAFISLIADVKYFPENPEFEYEKKEPVIGDVIVLAENDSLPNSIKHWALFLGDGYYLSKFGKSGYGTQSLLNIMSIDGMKTLYRSNCVFVAKPKTGAKKWDGYKQLIGEESKVIE